MDFNTAINLIKDFEINNSKDHYEIIMRKLELEKLMREESTQIAPISLDGRCNVYQHLSALTKDEFIAPFVNTTTNSRDVDIYNWFKSNLIEELESENEAKTYAKFWLDLKARGANLRNFVKKPIMTYPYGSTPYNVREHVHSTLKNHLKIADWERVKYLSDKIINLRKKTLDRVEKLQHF